MGARTHARALAIVLGLSLIGCGDGDDDASAPDGGQETGSPSSLGMLAEVAPAAGADPVCRALTGDALASVGDDLVALADPATADDARRRLGRAAETLRSTDADGAIGEAIAGAADALEALVAADSTAEPLEDVSDALDRLGDEAQALCDFPVG